MQAALRPACHRHWRRSIISRDSGRAFQYNNQIVATAGYATAVALGSDWEAMANGYRQ
jgi:hypothetical protein